MKELEFSGVDIDDALKKAAEELKVTIDNLDFEIVSSGNKGLFGLLGKKAAVIRVSLEGTKKMGHFNIEDERETKQASFSGAKKTHVATEAPAKSQSRETIRESGRDKVAREDVKKGSDEQKNTFFAEKKSTPVPEKNVAPEKKASPVYEKNTNIAKEPIREKKAEEGRALLKTQTANADKSVSASLIKDGNVPLNKSEEPRVAAEKEDYTKEVKEIEDFVRHILKYIEEAAQISACYQKGRVLVTVKSSSSGKIIGKGGHIINSVEYITTKYAHKILGEGKKAVIRIEDEPQQVSV